MTVYFDNAATTRPCEEAVNAAVKAMNEVYGNPSSTHHQGREAAKLLENARNSVAAALGASPGEVYFTSGGTEADNWALKSACELRRHRGRHIISSLAEHDAVLKSLQKLESAGFEVTYLKPDKSGRITADAVAAAVREDTVLVSVMLVNNETSAVNPIGEIAKQVHGKNPDIIVHTDAVQGFMKVPFTPKTLGADLVSISAHKIHGMKGAGALWIRKGLRMPQFISGGGQESSMRPGTEAVPAIAAFGAAAEMAKRDFEQNTGKMHALRKFTMELLEKEIPGVVFIGKGEAPHIMSISVPGYGSEVLMNCLDADGICVSKSSACKKGARSHVLEAMGLPAGVIDGAIRVSFSRYSTEEEARYFVDSLKNAASRLRKR